MKGIRKMKKKKEQDKSICNIAKNYILENGINDTDKRSQSKKSSNTLDKSISKEDENTTKQK